MKAVTVLLWIDPKTKEPSNTPIEVGNVDAKNLKKIQNRGFKYRLVVDGLTDDEKPKSYAGLCALCGDLIRSELELAHHKVNGEKLAQCHRFCLEGALAK